MKDVFILAIESSCDETAMAVIKNGNVELSHVINTQADHFSELGGVVPEMASRMHVDNINKVYKKTLEDANITIEEIDAIAVTYGPGLIGSLLVGVNFANSLAQIYNKKIIPVNHMHGHIYALELEQEIKYPMISLIVSGGHTEIVYVKNQMEFEIIGQTLDDAVGECFDKVAKILDLGYPGGPKIDKLAKDGSHTYTLPTPMNDDSYNFSYSGLKSAAFNLTNKANMKGETINKADFAASFQEVAIDILIKKLKRASENYEHNTISIVGGVSANSLLKEKAKEELNNCLIPSLVYSTDNAAMIGVVGYHLYNANISVLKYANAKPNISVETTWKN